RRIARSPGQPTAHVDADPGAACAAAAGDRGRQRSCCRLRAGPDAGLRHPLCEPRGGVPGGLHQHRGVQLRHGHELAPAAADRRLALARADADRPPGGCRGGASHRSRGRRGRRRAAARARGGVGGADLLAGAVGRAPDQARHLDGPGDPLRAGGDRVRGPPADHEHLRPGRARGDRRLPGEVPGGVRGLSVSELFDVSGKSALVTGGSRGIGLMIARGLVQAGARVIVSSRKSADVQGTAQELAAFGECHAIPGDVSTPEGAAALAAGTVKRFGSLDILVNNAGAVWGAPLEEFPQAGWEKVLHTNVEGVFHLTVALLEALRTGATPSDPARVINIGSIDGLRTPGVENYSYSASKAAVHMLTRHLAKRLASDHITVNGIAPGPLERKMMAFALEDPESREAIERSVPLGRIGHPDDVAGCPM